MGSVSTKLLLLPEPSLLILGTQSRKLSWLHILHCPRSPPSPSANSIFISAFCIVPELTTSYCLLCGPPGLSHHHLLPPLLQLPLSWPPDFHPCSPYHFPWEPETLSAEAPFLLWAGSSHGSQLTWNASQSAAHKPSTLWPTHSVLHLLLSRPQRTSFRAHLRTH